MKNEQGGHRVSSGLMQGAFLLAAAAVVSKVLGTMQKIPMQNLAGDEVFGIYNAVYPIYILIMMLATAGFPVAVSAFVAERVSMGKYREARRVLKVASITLWTSGIAAFLFLYFGADVLSVWIGVSGTSEAIRSVSFALLVVPVLSVLRGYFQGLGNMAPTAFSQVWEQFIRVLTMVILLLYFLRTSASPGTIAAGATFGSVTGALAGLLVVLYYWRKAKGVEQSPQSMERAESTAILIRRFVRYAIPVALGAIVMPILTLVDTFTMPRLLKASGLLEGQALEQFGLYNRGLPLVQTVTLIASSVSAAVVPAITSAKARGDSAQIQSTTELCLRIAWLIGWAAAIGMAMAAEPLNIMFYTDSQGTFTMQVLAFTVLFSVLNIISGSILQGFGAVVIPVVSLLVASVVKLALNLMLMPELGIAGAAYSAVAAYIVAASINLIYVRKLTGTSFHGRTFLVRPVQALFALAVCLFTCLYGLQALLGWLTPEMPSRLVNTIVSLVSVGVAVVIYILSIVFTGAISGKELSGIPKLQKLQKLQSKLPAFITKKF